MRDGGNLWRAWVLGVLVPAAGAGAVEFQLLTWSDAQATDALPSAAGLKPGKAASPNDWLVFTPDDDALPIANNGQGALSHNFADLTGSATSVFNMAPSLTGTLSLDFTPVAGGEVAVAVTHLNYSGQANAAVNMNQFLVTAGESVAQNPVYGVNGTGNHGTWSGGGTWDIQYHMDFYLATNADGDPSPADVDVAFEDTLHRGYLLPVAQLTAGLRADDPVGFFGGDFGQYLSEQIAPRLPVDATYLLVTQMAKTNPVYSESGLPFTTSMTIGNTTIAYTTGAVPEPSALVLVAVGGWVFARRGRSSFRSIDRKV